MHNRWIDFLFRHKNMWYCHYPFLEISVNWALSIYSFPSYIIYVLISGNNSYTMYWQSFQAQQYLMSVLPHHENESQQSIIDLYCFKSGNQNVIWLWLNIMNVMAAFIGNRDSDMVIAPSWESVSEERQSFLALYHRLSKRQLVADIHQWGISRL